MDFLPRRPYRITEEAICLDPIGNKLHPVTPSGKGVLRVGQIGITLRCTFEQALGPNALFQLATAEQEVEGHPHVGNQQHEIAPGQEAAGLPLLPKNPYDDGNGENKSHHGKNIGKQNPQTPLKGAQENFPEPVKGFQHVLNHVFPN